MTVGCKLLTAEGESLSSVHGRVRYPVGEWVEVPGNGAYVAVTGDILCAGVGPILAYLECAEELDVQNTAPGVRCYRRVRRLAEPAPDRISPALRAYIARWIPGVSPAERLELARTCSPALRAEIARYRLDLTADDRLALVRDCSPRLRASFACCAPDLSPEQRLALARTCTRQGRAKIARWAPGLSPAQRLELRLTAVPIKSSRTGSHRVPPGAQH